MRILKIYKDNCVPCHMLTFLLDDLSISVDNLEATAETVEKYSLKSVPVLLFLDDYDNVVDRILGLPTKQLLVRKLEENGYGHSILPESGSEQESS